MTSVNQQNLQIIMTEGGENYEIKTHQITGKSGRKNF